MRIFKKEPWFYNRRFLADNSNLIKGDVVDVGCGQGKYKDLISGSPQVKSYTGVDFYDKQADIVADLNNRLPIEDNKFDTAICISVMEHLLEPQIALREMARILKPDGHLFLSTVWIYPYHSEPDDYFRYNGKCLKYHLEKAGFEIVSVLPYGGKITILITFLMVWFPFFGRFSSIIDRFLSLSSKKESSENIINYQVIAKKIKA